MTADEVRFREVTEHPDTVEQVHLEASHLIAGYAVPPDHLQRDRRRVLEALFAPAAAPAAIRVYAALTNDRRIVGGVVIECATLGVETIDPTRARTFARAHRTVSALFVGEPVRGRNVGRDLLVKAVGRDAFQESVRYLDGFVDDRNNSAGFYRRIGATVLPRNTGLPDRSPAHVPQAHVPGVSGHWFYLDLWRQYINELVCNRCRSPLYFNEEQDTAACPRCPPPPTRKQRAAR